MHTRSRNALDKNGILTQMTTKTHKTKKTRTRAEKPAFSLTLVMGGRTYSGVGATEADALSNLERPNKIMAKGVLTVSSGDSKKVIAMTPLRIKQLFLTSRSLRAIRAKTVFAATK